MNTFVATISKIILGPPIRWLLIKKIDGWENIPEQNFILVSNHLSHSDWFMSGYICAPKKFVFIGQVDQYNTGFNAIWRRLIYWWASTIPVDRKSDESKRQAIANAVQMLKNGYRVVIYPEGGRAYDGVMKEFKPGVGILYLETGVPVLPVALKGTREILPPHGKLKIKKIVEISIGKPLDFAKEQETAAGFDKDSEQYHKLCADITQKIENKVRKLLEDMSNVKS